MPRSYATVGQMMTYAVDRAVSSPDLDLHRRGDGHIELMLRHMLEFVLMSPRSREAFLRTVARDERATGSITAAPRPRRSSPDLVGEILPDEEHPDGGRLGACVRVGRHTPTEQVARLRRELGPGAAHLLVLVVRKAEVSDQVAAVQRLQDAIEDDGPEMMVASWRRIGRRMPKADPGHAHLWDTIGEIGEHAGSPIVQFPLNARSLLTDAETAAEMRAHLDVLREASRTLLGASARFSTRRGQEEAALQVGVTRHRTGVAFGEVDHGTPVHLQRADGTSHPLGIGHLRLDEEREAAHEHLAAIARCSAWRTDSGTLPDLPELIGAPASPELEGARRILWAVLNPALLRDRGFDLAPSRRQPALSATSLGLRLLHRGDPTRTVYGIWLGGTRRWDTLIPRVTREAGEHRPAETYAVAPRKGQSTSDFVWEVHKALRSLTIPPLR